MVYISMQNQKVVSKDIKNYINMKFWEVPSCYFTEVPKKLCMTLAARDSI